MPPFEILGPYRLGELIGRGGMGNVYAAEHVKTGDRVAVKLIAPHIADEPRFRRRFDREIRAMQMLRHPGIVRLVGFGEEAGQLFYSMEIVEGETLQARIRRERKLHWEQVIELSIQIASALKHAHDVGITHRDIKPANLLLNEEGQIKLVDFGIPKLFGDLGDQTGTGSVLGTPDYMAPEQATGDSITPRTDLYSLGSVMYAMLAGRAPFKGKNATSVIEALRRERPIPLEMLETNMPSELSELVHHLLEKRPEDRPPTALVVLNRLKSMQAGLGQKRPDAITDIATSDLEELAFGGDTDFANPSSITDLSITDSVRDAANAPDPIDQESETVQRPRTVVSRSNRINPGADKPIASADSPTDLTHNSGTIASRADAVETDDPASVTSTTHFQTVDDHPLTPRSFDANSESEHSNLSRWLAGTALVALLGIFGFAFYRATIPPTADQLYREIIEQDDMSAADVFLRRFPDDDRHPQVETIRMNARLAATLRRLKAKSKLGLKPLTPAEEGFLAVLNSRSGDPETYSDRVASFIDAFEDPDANVMTRELIELAEFEKTQSQLPRAEALADPRSADLLAKVDSILANDDTTEVQKRLSGIVETFQGKSWAKPAVEKARAALNAGQ